MKYFYARVSTKGQNLARQFEAAKTVDGIDRIFSDKLSGKNFDRPDYQSMKETVKAGDEIVIKSLDRLGRNKYEMKKELDWFRQHGVIVRVMDIPTTMIEMPQGQEWVIDMVNNILIEVIGAIAEQERKMIAERRLEGIAAMPTVDGRKVSAKTGRGFGRPKCDADMDEVRKISEQQKRGELTVADCCKRIGVSRATWYNLARAYQ